MYRYANGSDSRTVYRKTLWSISTLRRRPKVTRTSYLSITAPTGILLKTESPRRDVLTRLPLWPCCVWPVHVRCACLITGSHSLARRGRSSWRGWRARGGWPPLQRREGRPLPPPRPPPLRAASFAQRRACAWECPSVGPTAGVGLRWARPAGRQGWRTPGTSSAPALRPLPSPPPWPCSCADGQTRACAPPSGQSVPHRRPARATDRQGCRRPQPPLPPPLS